MSNVRTGSRLAHNGIQYLLANDPGTVTYRTSTQTGLSPKVFTAMVASDATGAVTIGLPTSYFTSILFAEANCVRDTANPALGAFAMIRSFTTSQVVVQCFESKNSGVLIGGFIEGLELATSALNIQLLVIGI